ncbi:MAG TPA: polysaccharide deacetylase family protein [Glycomyces sp.]|nr:polysaccharide deacetylase family protein [Glycomyces sp.]
MRRFKIGIGVVAAATAVMLLAWTWPEGRDPSGDDHGTETAASASPSAEAAAPTAGTGPSPEGAESSPAERAPSPQPTAESPVPARDPHGGPMGTRDRTGSNSVALTFDDGPDPNWTPRVLAELRERGVKATFCVIGAYAEAHPDLIADIVHDGHTLCSHTWFHELDLGERSTEEIRANLQRTNDAIEKAVPGADVAYFRHPGGKWTDRAVRVAADMGMESLHWDVDPSDWDRGVSEAQIRDHVADRTEPGSIVLLHDGASNQAHMFGALSSILDEFEHRDYAMAAL